MTEDLSTHIFVTDIPSEATMVDVLEAFEAFGQIQNISISRKDEKVSAFIEYKDPEVAKKVLETSHTDKSLVSSRMLDDAAIKILDQDVLVMEQRPKQEILDKHVKKDKRNLNLMFEGHITEDMPQAKGVPPNEMDKRKKLHAEKLKKLADTNYKVSDTRLAVFNLPESCTTGQLRKIFAVAPKKYARKHKEDPMSQFVLKNSVRITEVRLVESQPGVGFVQFTTHEHALYALREVNNNPGYFEDRRLIVEFALVNNYVMKEKLERKLSQQRDPKKFKGSFKEKHQFQQKVKKGKKARQE